MTTNDCGVPEITDWKDGEESRMVGNTKVYRSYEAYVFDGEGLAHPKKDQAMTSTPAQAAQMTDEVLSLTAKEMDRYYSAMAAAETEPAHWEARLVATITTLRAQLDEARQWVNDLQSGMYVNCVYCGHRYGPGETTPVSMADALKAHVEQCPEHPMAALKAQLEKVEGERDAAKEEAANEASHAAHWQEHCRRLEGELQKMKEARDARY